jgi:hypothetical protein
LRGQNTDDFLAGESFSEMHGVSMDRDGVSVSRDMVIGNSLTKKSNQKFVAKK